MSATVLGNKIYVSSKLKERLTEREYKVLLAHEVGHFMAKDRLKIIGLMLALTLATAVCFIYGQYLAGVIAMFTFNPIVQKYQRHIELNADRFALRKTNDFTAFVSLMDKLDHNGTTHPSKAERLKLATDMRDTNE